jgi:dihydrofolate reductase
MRRAIYYFTMSLDGYLADAQGSTSWMSGAPNTDYGYEEFYAGIDTLLLGRNTYEHLLAQVAQGDFFPYADKEVVVFSSKQKLKRLAPKLRIESEDARRVLARLLLNPGNDIWIGGGARLAGSLFQAGLIAELRVFVQPIVLGAGLPFLLLPAAADATQAPQPGASFSLLRVLEWTYSHSWPGGIQELRYCVPKRWRADLGQAATSGENTGEHTGL